MIKILQAILFVCLFFSAIPVHAEIDAPFDRLQGKAWALVLTGPEDGPLYLEQMALLQPQAETLKARQMVVIHFHGRTLKTYPDLSVYDYQLPSMRNTKKGMSVHRKIENLEGALQTDDDVFSVVLVGMDGVTKYVWTLAAVRPDLIFQMMDHPVPMDAPAVPPAADPKHPFKLPEQ